MGDDGDDDDNENDDSLDIHDDDDDDKTENMTVMATRMEMVTIFIGTTPTRVIFSSSWLSSLL